MVAEGVIDVVVVGGGQAGLAAGYFLRRAGLDFVILDEQKRPGGAWRHGWESLRLFSPAEYGRLPGWAMPPEEGEKFPTAAHVVSYLEQYEKRYELPVRRGVHVRSVRVEEPAMRVETDQQVWRARAVISATGTWRSPYMPLYPGHGEFAGRQLHTVNYRNPNQFANERVVVVGGGNSAAQILAEVSTVAETAWVTTRPARFMPDDVDGRVLFDAATQRDAARRAGREHDGVGGLGDIVMVPPVLEARRRGVLNNLPMFSRLTPTGIAWSDGAAFDCDAIIWCTGFRPNLAHLRPLKLASEGGHPLTDGTRSTSEPRLHLLGYGDWTGFASATLIGASRTAKLAVSQIVAGLN